MSLEDAFSGSGNEVGRSLTRMIISACRERIGLNPMYEVVYEVAPQVPPSPPEIRDNSQNSLNLVGAKNSDLNAGPGHNYQMPKAVCFFIWSNWF